LVNFRESVKDSSLRELVKEKLLPEIYPDEKVNGKVEKKSGVLRTHRRWAIAHFRSKELVNWIGVPQRRFGNAYWMVQPMSGSNTAGLKFDPKGELSSPFTEACNDYLHADILKVRSKVADTVNQTLVLLPQTPVGQTFLAESLKNNHRVEGSSPPWGAEITGEFGQLGSPVPKGVTNECPVLQASRAPDRLTTARWLRRIGLPGAGYHPPWHAISALSERGQPASRRVLDGEGVQVALGSPDAGVTEPGLERPEVEPAPQAGRGEGMAELVSGERVHPGCSSSDPDPVIDLAGLVIGDTSEFHGQFRGGHGAGRARDCPCSPAFCPRDMDPPWVNVLSDQPGDLAVAQAGAEHDLTGGAPSAIELGQDRAPPRAGDLGREPHSGVLSEHRYLLVNPIHREPLSPRPAHERL
jgi:hypothetical protein